MAAGDLTDLRHVKAWLGFSATTGDSQLSGARSPPSRPSSPTTSAASCSRPATSKPMAAPAGLDGAAQGPDHRGASVAFAGRTLTTPADPVALTSGFFFDGRA